MDVVQTISNRRPSEDSRQYAYRTIREAILLFVLEPGLRLSEPELAAKLSVSRTPVHDALERLERENLTVSGDTPGFTVTRLQTAKIRSHLWLAELFTTEVIHAFFTERVAPQKIEILQFMIKEMEHASNIGNIHGELRIINNFFTQMYTFGGSFDYIWSVLQKSIYDIARLLYLTLQETGPKKNFLTAMNAMVEALIRRNDDAACAAEHRCFQLLREEIPVLQEKYPGYFDEKGEDWEPPARRA